MRKNYKNAAVMLMWIGDQKTYTGDTILVIYRFAELVYTLTLKPRKPNSTCFPMKKDKT